MADLKNLADQLVNLTIKQANELFTILKNDYGIEPVSASPVVVSQEASAQSKGAEEQSEFAVVLTSPGSSKLAVVKLVKEINGVGLKEAKELVDGAPSTLKEKLSKEDAESMKKKLEEAGAQVELK